MTAGGGGRASVREKMESEVSNDVIVSKYAKHLPFLILIDVIIFSQLFSNLIMHLRCTRCIFPHSSSSCLILKSPPVIPYSAQHCGSFSLFLLLLQQKCSRGYSEPLKAGPGSVINTQTHACTGCIASSPCWADRDQKKKQKTSQSGETLKIPP